MRGTGAADVYIVQHSGNNVESVKLQVPKGSKYKKIIVMECNFKNKYHERNILFYKVKLFSYLAYARFRC